ncbi:MAG: tetratricopeptide repeat protein [Opitutales bacterium]
MHSSRRWFLLLLGLVAGFTAGCGRKEVTSLQRKQAANLVSEAEFAVNLRDYARAEGLLAQAVAVCPDTPEYWLNLGSVRRRLGNRAGAKDAYEQMLGLARDNYRRNAKDPEPLLQQVYVLALLGRMDEARAALEKAQKDHPDDRSIRAFVESRQLDRLPEDPNFKAIAL